MVWGIVKSATKVSGRAVAKVGRPAIGALPAVTSAIDMGATVANAMHDSRMNELEARIAARRMEEVSGQTWRGSGESSQMPSEQLSQQIPDQQSQDLPTQGSLLDAFAEESDGRAGAIIMSIVLLIVLIIM